MHTRHHDDPGGPASATAREAETDQAASLTEAKVVKTRTGAGKEENIKRKREQEPENLAETAKEIRDRDRGSGRDKQYTLTQRPGKQFNIEL
jgi:hypothetical protein